MRTKLAVVVATASAVCLLSSCSWPSMRANAAHTGFEAGETVIGSGNVASLHEAWTTNSNELLGLSPIAPVAGGRMYAATPKSIEVYDAAGVNGCSGSPRTCQPLWTAPVDNPQSPVVAGGVLYVVSVPSGPDVLEAFDARGQQGCSGTPAVCAPLWTSQGVSPYHFVAPTVANGVVYVSATPSLGPGAQVLLAFDAAGRQGCTGAPVACAPMWTATVVTTATSQFNAPLPPAVAGGRVYVTGVDARVHVYDAAGSQGCGASPKQCSELWIAAGSTPCADVTQSCALSMPAVSDGTLFVSSQTAADTGAVLAFDASGTAGCTGVPKVCTPRWSANNGGPSNPPFINPPAIAHGVVYTIERVASGGIYFGDRLQAFDETGTQGCAGAPTMCSPLWTSTTEVNAMTAPSVANDVVYVTGVVPQSAPECFPYNCENRHLLAFDAAGHDGCTGIPTVCDPLLDLHEQSFAPYADPVIANGVVYVADGPTFDSEISPVNHVYAFTP